MSDTIPAFPSPGEDFLLPSPPRAKRNRAKRVGLEKKTLSAIPTVYRGVELKSRLEAQAAVLFDRCGWEWQYEPKSYMLECGIAYRPDFWIPKFRMFVEVRGYTKTNSEKQLEEFEEEARSQCLGGPDGKRIFQFARLQENNCLFHYFRLDGQDHFSEATLLVKCHVCGWEFMGLDQGGCRWCCCHQCVLEKAFVVQVLAGKLLLNGVESDRWDRLIV